MSFVTSEKMLLDAKKGGYAVGAFNVENMEMVCFNNPLTLRSCYWSVLLERAEENAK